MKWFSQRNLTAVLLFALVAFATGCINYDTRMVQFNYQPVAQVQPADGQAVTVVHPDNLRKTRNPKIIGQVRDGYSIPFAEVMCESGDITTWIAEALRLELTKAGYRVEAAGDLDEATAPRVIKTEINKFYIDGYRKVNAEAVITFTVICHGQTVFSKQYEGQHIISSFTTYSKGAVHHHPAARQAVEKLMAPAIADISAALKNCQ